MHDLREVDAPIPEALALVTRHVLEQEVRGVLEPLPELGAIPDRVFETASEARTLGVKLDLTSLRPVLRRAIARLLDVIAAEPSEERVRRATALIDGARSLAIPYGHWATQNRFFQIWRERPDAHDSLRPLAITLGFNLGE